MLSVRNLTKRYGKNLVLDDVSFELPPAGITFLMGENGAGKTTLLKAILELESFTGEVRWDRRAMHEISDEIAVVFDDSPAYRGLSGYTNIDLLCPKRVDRERIHHAANRYLGDQILRRAVRRYSYGQRKKLSLVTALVSEPRYLIMDEVSNGLDYETMEDVKRELTERAKRCTIFLTGHQFDFYNSIVNRVLVLKDGKISEHQIPERPEMVSSPLGQLYERTIKDVS